MSSTEDHNSEIISTRFTLTNVTFFYIFGIVIFGCNRQLVKFKWLLVLMVAFRRTTDLYRKENDFTKEFLSTLLTQMFLFVTVWLLIRKALTIARRSGMPIPHIRV